MVPLDVGDHTFHVDRAPEPCSLARVEGQVPHHIVDLRLATSFYNFSENLLPNGLFYLASGL